MLLYNILRVYFLYIKYLYVYSVYLVISVSILSFNLVYSILLTSYLFVLIIYNLFLLLIGALKFIFYYLTIHELIMELVGAGKSLVWLFIYSVLFIDLLLKWFILFFFFFNLYLNYLILLIKILSSLLFFYCKFLINIFKVFLNFLSLTYLDSKIKLLQDRKENTEKFFFFKDKIKVHFYNILRRTPIYKHTLIKKSTYKTDLIYELYRNHLEYDTEEGVLKLNEESLDYILDNSINTDKFTSTYERVSRLFKFKFEEGEVSAENKHILKSLKYPEDLSGYKFENYKKYFTSKESDNLKNFSLFFTDKVSKEEQEFNTFVLNARFSRLKKFKLSFYFFVLQLYYILVWRTLRNFFHRIPYRRTSGFTVNARSYGRLILRERKKKKSRLIHTKFNLSLLRKKGHYPVIKNKTKILNVYKIYRPYYKMYLYALTSYRRFMYRPLSSYFGIIARWSRVFLKYYIFFYTFYLPVFLFFRQLIILNFIKLSLKKGLDCISIIKILLNYCIYILLNIIPFLVNFFLSLPFLMFYNLIFLSLFFFSCFINFLYFFFSVLLLFGYFYFSFYFFIIFFLLSPLLHFGSYFSTVFDYFVINLIKFFRFIVYIIQYLLTLMIFGVLKFGPFLESSYLIVGKIYTRIYIWLYLTVCYILNLFSWFAGFILILFGLYVFIFILFFDLYIYGIFIEELSYVEIFFSLIVVIFCIRQSYLKLLDQFTDLFSIIILLKKNILGHLLNFFRLITVYIFIGFLVFFETVFDCFVYICIYIYLSYLKVFYNLYSDFLNFKNLVTRIFFYLKSTCSLNLRTKVKVLNYLLNFLGLINNLFFSFFITFKFILIDLRLFVYLYIGLIAVFMLDTYYLFDFLVIIFLFRVIFIYIRLKFYSGKFSLKYFLIYLFFSLIGFELIKSNDLIWFYVFSLHKKLFFNSKKEIEDFNKLNLDIINGDLSDYLTEQGLNTTNNGYFYFQFSSNSFASTEMIISDLNLEEEIVFYDKFKLNFKLSLLKLLESNYRFGRFLNPVLTSKFYLKFKKFNSANLNRSINNTNYSEYFYYQVKDPFKFNFDNTFYYLNIFIFIRIKYFSILYRIINLLNHQKGKGLDLNFNYFSLNLLNLFLNYFLNAVFILIDKRLKKFKDILELCLGFFSKYLMKVFNLNRIIFLQRFLFLFTVVLVYNIIFVKDYIIFTYYVPVILFFALMSYLLDLVVFFITRLRLRKFFYFSWLAFVFIFYLLTLPLRLVLNLVFKLTLYFFTSLYCFLKKYLLNLYVFVSTLSSTNSLRRDFIAVFLSKLSLNNNLLSDRLLDLPKLYVGHKVSKKYFSRKYRHLSGLPQRTETERFLSLDLLDGKIDYNKSYRSVDLLFDLFYKLLNFRDFSGFTSDLFKTYLKIIDNLNVSNVGLIFLKFYKKFIIEFYISNFDRYRDARLKYFEFYREYVYKSFSNEFLDVHYVKYLENGVKSYLYNKYDWVGNAFNIDGLNLEEEEYVIFIKNVKPFHSGLRGKNLTCFDDYSFVDYKILDEDVVVDRLFEKRIEILKSRLWDGLDVNSVKFVFLSDYVEYSPKLITYNFTSNSENLFFVENFIIKDQLNKDKHYMYSWSFFRDKYTSLKHYIQLNFIFLLKYSFSCLLEFVIYYLNIIFKLPFFVFGKNLSTLMLKYFFNDDKNIIKKDRKLFFSARRWRIYKASLIRKRWKRVLKLDYLRTRRVSKNFDESGFLNNIENLYLKRRSSSLRYSLMRKNSFLNTTFEAIDIGFFFKNLYYILGPNLKLFILSRLRIRQLKLSNLTRLFMIYFKMFASGVYFYSTAFKGVDNQRIFGAVNLARRAKWQGYLRYFSSNISNLTYLFFYNLFKFFTRRYNYAKKKKIYSRYRYIKFILWYEITFNKKPVLKALKFLIEENYRKLFNFLNSYLKLNLRRYLRIKKLKMVKKFKSFYVYRPNQFFFKFIGLFYDLLFFNIPYYYSIIIFIPERFLNFLFSFIIFNKTFFCGFFDLNLFSIPKKYRPRVLRNYLALYFKHLFVVFPGLGNLDVIYVTRLKRVSKFIKLFTYINEDISNGLKKVSITRNLIVIYFKKHKMLVYFTLFPLFGLFVVNLNIYLNLLFPFLIYGIVKLFFFLFRKFFSLFFNINKLSLYKRNKDLSNTFEGKIKIRRKDLRTLNNFFTLANYFGDIDYSESQEFLSGVCGVRFKRNRIKHLKSGKFFAAYVFIKIIKDRYPNFSFEDLDRKGRRRIKLLFDKFCRIYGKNFKKRSIFTKRNKALIRNSFFKKYKIDRLTNYFYRFINFDNVKLLQKDGLKYKINIKNLQYKNKRKTELVFDIPIYRFYTKNNFLIFFYVLEILKFFWLNRSYIYLLFLFYIFSPVYLLYLKFTILLVVLVFLIFFVLIRFTNFFKKFK